LKDLLSFKDVIEGNSSGHLENILVAAYWYFQFRQVWWVVSLKFFNMWGEFKLICISSTFCVELMLWYFSIWRRLSSSVKLVIVVGCCLLHPCCKSKTSE